MGIWKEAVVVHLKTIYVIISRCEDIAICWRQADRCWITRGSRNLDIVHFQTLRRIRASVVTKGTNILQLCFPTCQIPQNTGCQGGQGSLRAASPSEEEEESYWNNIAYEHGGNSNYHFGDLIKDMGLLFNKVVCSGHAYSQFWMKLCFVMLC
jgi:hypothetical protein